MFTPSLSAHSRLLLLLAVLIVLLVTQVHGVMPAAAPITDDPPLNQFIDLDFPGGTAEELISALRQVAPDANIVVMPGGDEYLVPPMQLRRVTASGVLQTLERTAHRRNGHGEVEIVPTGNPLVYAVRFRHVPFQSGRDSAANVRPISVAEVVGEAVSAEDLLTALETALDLASDGAGHPAAALRYHPETKLLIVRGNAGQIDIAHEIVAQLHVTAGHIRREASQSAGQNEVRRERDQLLSELNMLRSEVIHLRAAQEEAMLVRSHLEERLQKTIEELDHCKARAMDLKHAYRALERERLRPDGGDQSN